MAKKIIRLSWKDSTLQSLRDRKRKDEEKRGIFKGRRKNWQPNPSGPYSGFK